MAVVGLPAWPVRWAIFGMVVMRCRLLCVCIREKKCVKNSEYFCKKNKNTKICIFVGRERLKSFQIPILRAYIQGESYKHSWCENPEEAGINVCRLVDQGHMLRSACSRED